MKKLTKLLFMITITSILISCENSKYDLSSPESCINTLVKASSEKDKNGLSLCYSKQSPGEFQSIVNKNLTDNDLDEIKEMFENITIKSTTIEGNNATISIKFSKIDRDEEIKMVKENENWVILDF